MSKKDRPYVIGILAFVSMALTLGCYAMFITRIPPGTVGVVVNLIGNEQGVEDKELTVGLHIVAPWKDVYQFPTFEQNHIWNGDHGFQFQTSEGLVVGANMGITYNLRPDHIPVLFQKYRRGMDEITDIFIRNNVRDAINRHASKLRIEDLYGTHKDRFMDDIQSTVAQELASLGIVISRIYLIGSLHFPAGVVAALNAKIEATQRAQQRENELREAEAQAAKDVAAAQGAAQSLLVEAHAKAEANRLLQASITPELLMYQAISRWDGCLPTYLAGQLPLPVMEVAR